MKPSAVPLKQIGIWTGAFERQPASKVQEAGAALEKLGYGAIWFSEGLGRETFTQAALLLAGTSRILVVLTFFIAGLLYLLRFERVDNLGAYSIPSDTGLLIPSDFVNHPANR